MHKHHTCKHNLKHCTHCDVVYCTKCSKEWGGHNHYYYNPYRWAYTYWSANDGNTVRQPEGTVVCNHSE